MSEEEIFHEALARDPADRAAYLDQACDSDPALRAAVEALLRADQGASGFLDAPAERYQPTVNLPSVPGPGTVIAGRYKLLEEIGEGGMGTVWMAEQTEPVQRRVAVKLIKPGMDSRQVVARFEAERQALALMDHPNIAKVFDGGYVGCSLREQPADSRSESATIGRPFFVMELVKGTPITKYCDEKKLPVRERLELFADVCRAVQHAHQKGIIHRDLKPSNVMVAPYDGRAVVKVIDFGVAKATGQRLSDTTLFTGFGAVVGTPEYMSPEQAELNNADIDTRSDIYSLGVLLYELLTGTTPLTRERVKESSLLESLRIIREEDVPTLSQRLGTTVELPAIATNRGVDPARLRKLVRGELDWIVMKSLEKDRNRRYEAANAFAADVQRYLADEPVQACPPSAGYRLRKFARRNKGPMLAASLVFVALVIGVIGTTLGLVRAERQRQIAQDNEQKAVAAAEAETKAKRSAEAREAETKAVLEFVERKILAAARPEVNGGLGRQVTLRRAIEEALPFVENSFKDQPLIEARLRVTIGWSFYLLGTREGYNAAADQFRAARVLYASQLGADHIDSIHCGTRMANAYYMAGRNAEAADLFDETLPLLRAKLGPNHPATLVITDLAVQAYRSLGRYGDALQLQEEVLAALGAKLGRDHPDTLSHLRQMSFDYSEAGRHEDALRVRAELLAAYQARPGPVDPNSSGVVIEMADICANLNRHAEGILTLEEWLTHLRAKYRADPSSDQRKSQSIEEKIEERYTAAIRQLGALKLRDDIVAIRKAKDGPDHPSAALLASLQTLARRCTFRGQHVEAVRLDEEVLAMHQAKFGPDAPATYRAMEHLASTYSLARRRAEAFKLLEDRLARHVARLGPDHLDTLMSKLKLATCYSGGGRHADALKLHEEVLALRRSKLGPDHPDTLMSMRTVALFLVKLKRGAEALPLIDECARHADRKDIDPTMIPTVMGLRLEHFETVRDAAGCRATAELWEKLNRTDADSLYTAARMRAVTAGVMRRADPNAGPRAEDAVAEADRAMAWLKRATAAGFRNAASIKAGKHFDALRDRDDFARLVADLEEKAKPRGATRPARKKPYRDPALAAREVAPPPRVAKR